MRTLRDYYYKIKHGYFRTILWSVDVTINAIFGGELGQTISARIGCSKNRLAVWLTDRDGGHCEQAAIKYKFNRHYRIDFFGETKE